MGSPKFYHEEFHRALKLSTNTGRASIVHHQFIQLVNATFNGNVREATAKKSQVQITYVRGRTANNTSSRQELIICFSQTSLKSWNSGHVAT